jgi:hypothetical protein
MVKNSVAMEFLQRRKQSVSCKNIRETGQDGKRESLRLPARSPNLNSYAERWVRVDQRRVSVEADIVWSTVAAMSIAAIIVHCHEERNRQGKADLVSFADGGERTWEQCGGIQQFWLCKSKKESNQFENSSL